MKHRGIKFASPVLIAAALGSVFWVSAGDLNPPPGPIAPTQRTPVGPNTTPGDADSLFKITQRGSYYLTGNITGVSGKMGIEIAAGGITLDLMGFDLLGVAGSLDGVGVSAGGHDIAVVNGSVQAWAQDGVDLAKVTNNRLADLRVSGNGGNGINSGTHAVVTGCGAFGNGGYGIFAGDASTITNCSASYNTGDGIKVFAGTITNCSARVNGGGGIVATLASTITNCSALLNNGGGIVVLRSSTISNCSAYTNTGAGIRVDEDCTVRGNTCDSNGIYDDGAGIHATGSDNRIEGNDCTGNTRGIDVDVAGNIIIKNTASGNTTNYDIVADNKVGVIVVPPNSLAISGSTGGAGVGTTDPWANFSY